MGNSNQDTLLDDFSALQWQGASSGQSAQTPTEGLVEALQNAVEASSGTVRPTVTSSSQNEDSSTSGTSVLSKVLESGLGLGGLVGDFIGLFGGGGSTPTTEPVKYSAPAPISIDTAWTPSGLVGADYDQNGMPRTYGADASASSIYNSASSAYDDSSSYYGQTAAEYGGGGLGLADAFPIDGDGARVPAGASTQTGSHATSATGASSSAQATGAGAGAQITVNVQALDAQSLMDRSSDIAAAVRNAMLNLNPINDVVNDL